MISLTNVAKRYGNEKRLVHALRDVSLEIGSGEFVVVRGPSGSGKTTLLLILGAMLRPTAGQVKVLDRDIYSLSVAQRSRFRAENVGFVFQMFHLLPYLNVFDNVLISCRAGGRKTDKESVKELIARVGLKDRMFHKPAALSAGEKQRAALARALINSPGLILADEPTGNLDPENAGLVMDILQDFNRKGGTVVVVTHGDRADRMATKIVRLENGKIVG